MTNIADRTVILNELMLSRRSEVLDSAFENGYLDAIDSIMEIGCVRNNEKTRKKCNDGSNYRLGLVTALADVNEALGTSIGFDYDRR